MNPASVARHYLLSVFVLSLCGLATAAEPSVIWRPLSDPHAEDTSPIAPVSFTDTGFDHGCQLSAGGCTPKVQFTFDFLILDRGAADSRGLIIDTGTGATVLRTDELIKNAETGVRLGMILLDYTGGPAVEVNYMLVDRFGERQTRVSSDPLTFTYFAGVPANPQNSYTASYKSELQSIETNLRHQLHSRVALLAGTRYVDLREAFNVTSDAGIFGSRTTNHLLGFQLGGDIAIANIRRSQLFSTIKAGVYYNDVDVRARAANTDGNPIAFVVDEDEVAVALDLVFGLLIPMGPQADFRIAYQGFYMDGIALAPDQADNYSLFTGTGSLDKTSIFYHGGLIGFDIFF